MGKSAKDEKQKKDSKDDDKTKTKSKNSKEIKDAQSKKEAKKTSSKKEQSKDSKDAADPTADVEEEPDEEFKADGDRVQKAVDYILAQKEIGMWGIVKIIGSGANGVVARVKHTKTGMTSVMKVALSSSSFRSLIWENEVMGRIIAAKGEDKTFHLVRKHGSGVTKGPDGDFLPYVVMENLPGNPVSIIGCCVGDELTSKVCEYGLQLLKAVYDLHTCGFLHRDIKPENLGLFNNELLVLYDLGMARSLADKRGDLREPRSNIGMRGTDEWASLSAELGRDQGIVDDLWGWFYVMVEWMNCTSKSPLAWAAFDDRPPLRHWQKSGIFNARIVLRNCPREFYQIHMYLKGLGRCESPNYFFLASILRQAKRHSDERQQSALNGTNNSTAAEKVEEDKEQAMNKIMNRLKSEEVAFFF